MQTVTIKTYTEKENISPSDSLLQDMIKNNEQTDVFVNRLTNIQVPADKMVYLDTPVTVDRLVIIFESPVDVTAIEYEIKLKVFACFEPFGKLLMFHTKFL